MLATCCFLAAPQAGAAPSGLKLSWASTDASTTMGVSWVTAASVGSVVQYGIASVSEHEKSGPAPSLLDGIGYVHEVELTGLLPNTVYKYRAGADGDWSPEHSFQTAPTGGCTPYSFVVLGDARSQAEEGPSPNWPTIHQEVKALSPRFILNGGDLVKDGVDIAQWGNWLTASEMVNPSVPMLPTIGNHDDGPGDGNSANYNRLFMLPTNSVTGTEDYWYVVYDNLVIFSLSTQTFDDFGAQGAWLEAVAAQHPGKWKLVFFHHPVFTTDSIASHTANEYGQNPAYGPSFDRAGIDIVIQSHNHIYERFRPLRYDPANPEEGVEVASYGNGPQDGRLYVVSGGAGSFLNVLIEYVLRPAPGSEVRLANYHYIKVSVAGSTLHYSAMRSELSPRGGAGLIDEVTLTRPGPDPCAQPGDPDGDGDGFPRSRDCNDADASVNPGSLEICGNAGDEDCSGTANPCPPPPIDEDHDGAPAVGDCDDLDARRFPENAEVECNGIDDDCDCLETCNGTSTDLCHPAVDAGLVVPDVGASQDLGAAVPPDSGVIGLADLGTSPEVDAGGPRPAGSGCGCRSASGASAAGGWLMMMMLVAYVSRRTR